MPEAPAAPLSDAASGERRRAGPLRRAARIALLLGAVLLLTRCTGVVESMAYLPSRAPFETPPGTEDVWFQSADGARLHGWFMPAANADPAHPRPAILHAHGNAGNVSTHDAFSRFLTRDGFHVLLFDYRRYGRSDDRGPLRRDALLHDTRAALAYLRSRPDVDAARIGLYGVSLGSVFALHAAAEVPGVRAVATVSAFSTWRGIAADLMPLLGPLLMPGGLDPAAAAERLGDRPYLIVHGMRDQIIAPRHADRLAEAAQAAGVPATLWTDPEGDHNSMVPTNPEAQRAIADFFTEHLHRETPSP